MISTIVLVVVFLQCGVSIDLDNKVLYQNVLNGNLVNENLSNLFDVEHLSHKCKNDFKFSPRKLQSPIQNLTDGFWNLKSKSNIHSTEIHSVKVQVTKMPSKSMHKMFLFKILQSDRYLESIY